MDTYLVAFAVALATSLLLVWTKHWHGHFSMDHVTGVQKFHTDPTPRVGGVAVLAGMLSGWYFAPEAVRDLLSPLLIASVPAFLAGILEDVTKKVGVVLRLWATMVSGVLACGLTGIALDRVDIPLVDDLLVWAPAAVIFTAFSVAGVANAINIIDGFNGLSTGTVMIILAALGSIACVQGDTALSLACALLFAPVLGFWIVNFPLGKLFLGDGGAYFVGFALAWLSVLLLMRNTTVSPWVALLACAYPVIEVLYSMWRRRRKKQPTGAPDNLHLHSLVKTQLIMPWLGHWPAHWRNAAVSPFMWLYATLPAMLSVLLTGAPVPSLVAALAAVLMVYHLIYRRLLSNTLKNT